MNKLLATTLSLGAILLLAGCNQQTQSINESEITSESWKTMIPQSCQSFFDGCNNCMRTADGEVACTRMFCEKYDTPKCLDEEQGGVQQIGMPNPASEYCVAQGGESNIKKDENWSEYGVCLIDGKEVEEWEYYRAAVGKANEEMAKTYIGRQLSEVQKEFETQNQILRIVAQDGEAMAITADYRPDRLNVAVEKGVITDAYFG